MDFKSNQIKTFQANKEKTIEKYTNRKVSSIVVSAAFRDAAGLANALVNTGQLKMDKYWETHKEFFTTFLDMYEKGQDGISTAVAEDMQNKVARKIELTEKNFEVRDEIPDGGTLPY